MTEWNTNFHGIAIRCSKKLVQIKNNKELQDYLDDPKSTGSVEISKYAHQLYEKEMGVPLKITTDSLAIEILAHVDLDTFAHILEKLKIKSWTSLSKNIEKHTDIIDCGEEDIDSNRAVWDELERKHSKKLIYFLSGKSA